MKVRLGWIVTLVIVTLNSMGVRAQPPVKTARTYSDVQMAFVYCLDATKSKRVSFEVYFHSDDPKKDEILALFTPDEVAKASTSYFKNTDWTTFGFSMKQDQMIPTLWAFISKGDTSLQVACLWPELAASGSTIFDPDKIVEEFGLSDSIK